MDFHEEFKRMPTPLRAMIRANPNKEEMLLLYLIETQFDKMQEILEASGVLNPKPCKKCYGRYRTGFKYPDTKIVAGELIKGREVVVLCQCIHKQLKKREGKLLIKWERDDAKEGRRNETSEESIRPTSGTDGDRSKEDKSRG